MRALGAGETHYVDEDPFAYAPHHGGRRERERRVKGAAVLTQTHAVVMAGGHGERFWPLSTRERPKQFMPFADNLSLLQMAVRRARQLAGASRVWISGLHEHQQLLRNQVRQVVGQDGDIRYIVEPCRRDTGPAIGLAAARILLSDPDAVMVSIPADHYVGDDTAWAECVGVACDAAAKGTLVTIGLRPSRPETGYGYIEVGTELDGQCRGQGPVVHHVSSFTEKPDEEVARSYVRSGRYLWNSGIFVWRAASILQAIEEHAPELAEGLHKVMDACRGHRGAAFDAAWHDAVSRVYPTLARISIDHAVMEKASNIAVVRGDFLWDDVGSWAAWDRMTGADSQGNRVAGTGAIVASSGTTVHNAEGGLALVAFGLRDVLFVAANGFVVAADKSRTGEWKSLLEELQDRGVANETSKRAETSVLASSTFSEWLDEVAPAADGGVNPGAPRIVQKPWGREIWWAVSERYAGKILQVNAGQALSLQYHEQKEETQLFLYGEGVLELEGEAIPIRPGLCRTIRPGQVHRIIAETNVALLEVSSPELDDVIRLKDRYGRAGGGATASPEPD